MLFWKNLFPERENGERGRVLYSSTVATAQPQLRMIGVPPEHPDFYRCGTVGHNRVPSKFFQFRNRFYFSHINPIIVENQFGLLSF